ncbi:uncharacterized protein BT62DRAFT_896719, partial [Guyanagaster necrorhizus]
LLFAIYSVLSKAANPDTYLLLKVIQSYFELDIYALINIHIKKSIKEERQKLEVLNVRLKTYSQATDHKGFKTSIMHAQQYLFDDIIAKGVTKNYNTKVNESRHDPLKEAYQTQTNFKNITEQIQFLIKLIK